MILRPTPVLEQSANAKLSRSHTYQNPDRRCSTLRCVIVSHRHQQSHNISNMKSHDTRITKSHDARITKLHDTRNTKLHDARKKQHKVLDIRHSNTPVTVSSTKDASKSNETALPSTCLISYICRYVLCDDLRNLRWL